jgi:hypothetical protein
MAVCYNLWSFGIFFRFLYVWTKKNLATLEGSFLKGGKKLFTYAKLKREVLRGRLSKKWSWGVAQVRAQFFKRIFAPTGKVGAYRKNSHLATVGTLLHLQCWRLGAKLAPTLLWKTRGSGVANVVVIVSASRTENPGFESRQGIFIYIAVLLWELNMHCDCEYLRKLTLQFF